MRQMRTKTSNHRQAGRVTLPRRVGRIAGALGVFSGARGTYPVVAGDQPLQAIVTLGNAAAATAGVCGESDFFPGECNFNGMGNTITCRK